MKFFNKRFFKFTLGFLVVVAISLMVIAAVSAYAQTSISKIVFTTEEQIIKPNELSGPITIQAQDSGGNAFQTPETIDLEFISSSPTGEFLGSTGNPATGYMSKNTANRTFYYRDSAEGTFTITINAMGRNSGQTWSNNQQINVSSSVSPNSNSSSISPGTSLNVSYSGSTISGPANTNSNISFSSYLEITAGQDRLTTPGSPITFQAFVKKNTSTGDSPSFNWSFGDGNVGAGDLVTHMYKYPGDYAVVLNAHLGNNFAVSRLKVKVIEPSIVLEEGDGYVEVINKSGSEINLFNWKLTRGHQSFVFQPDTIIFPNSSIKIDNSMLKMKSSEDAGTVLKNFMGNVVVTIPTQQQTANQNLALVEIIPESFYLAQADAVQTPNQVQIKKSEPEVLGEAITTETEIAEEFSDNIIYEAPKQSGLLAKIWTFLTSMLP